MWWRWSIYFSYHNICWNKCFTKFIIISITNLFPCNWINHQSTVIVIHSSSPVNTQKIGTTMMIIFYIPSVNSKVIVKTSKFDRKNHKISYKLHPECEQKLISLYETFCKVLTRHHRPKIVLYREYSNSTNRFDFVIQRNK